MAGIGSSVEDQIAKRLRLNEKNKKEQVEALIKYFRQIMNGEEKTAPLALKALMQMMFKKYDEDEEALMAKYFMQKEGELVAFFNKNFQRFNYYEFKPLIMQLRGETEAEEFKVPVNGPLNFDKIEPLDTTPYKDVLEDHPLDLKIAKEQAKKVTVDEINKTRTEKERSYEETIVDLKKQISDNISKGTLSKVDLEKRVQFAEESCIASLQLDYNTQAVKDLTDIFSGDIEDAGNKRISSIFDRLKMNQQMRERFYQLLSKKVV